jgi:Arm DNA-binding domain
MPLTNTAIRNSKPKRKPYKLHDERGLYLLVNAVGKYFGFDYRFERKRRTLALGVYPDVSLADARDKRDLARKLLADGTDPGAQRKALRASEAHRAANSFEVVAASGIANFHRTGRRLTPRGLFVGSSVTCSHGSEYGLSRK